LNRHLRAWKPDALPLNYARARTICRRPIHAAQKIDSELRDVEQRLGIELPVIATPRGGIVGLTNIVDCVATHASPWFSGPHGLVLKGSRELPFLPMKGFLRLR